MGFGLRGSYATVSEEASIAEGIEYRHCSVLCCSVLCNVGGPLLHLWTGAPMMRKESLVYQPPVRLCLGAPDEHAHDI